MLRPYFCKYDLVVDSTEHWCVWLLLWSATICIIKGNASDLMGRCYYIPIYYLGINIKSWIRGWNTNVVTLKTCSSLYSRSSKRCHCKTVMCRYNPWQQNSWGQHGAHLGPTGPRWDPCWPHELCYLGCSIYHYITQGTAMTVAEHVSDFNLTTDNPHLALTSELWGVCCDDFGENRPR